MVSRQRSYLKSTDLAILKEIKDLVSKRSTYGYRRVTAMLNRKRQELGQSAVNHKRIYRIMRANNLLLARHTGKATRTHEGKVITLASNMRWSADTFSIKCFNGEKVEVSFCIDTCDREIISYVALARPTQGSDIRDLIAQSFDKRFKDCDKLPRSIEWLSDNGPPYTAQDTGKFGEALGFTMCTTPSYNPESNGISEAFVKTFKRDYAYVNDLHCAQHVIKELEQWFEDYNENAPHKGLKMKSPRQLIKINFKN